MTDTLAQNRTDPQREYVAGGHRTLAGVAAQSLPWAIDDLTQELGDDVYAQMLRDPQIAACVNIFKTGILEDGPQLVPAVADKEADGYAQAAELVTVCERMLDDLETPLDDALWSLCDAIVVGNRVAEEVYALDNTYTGKSQLVLRKLKPKPRKAVAFVVNPYLDVLGFMAAQPGQAAPQSVGMIGDLRALANREDFLPRDKFALLTFRPVDGDPRGSSILRPAYNAWWLKMQTWPEYLKYLVQFASPSLWGTPGPDAVPGPDPEEDGRMMEPEEAMLRVLLEARNGTAMTFPHGSALNSIDMSGDGAAFLSAFSLYDKQMTVAILHQTLATGEAEFQAKASSEVHQNTLGRVIRQAKKAVQRMIRCDVLRSFVRYNYGDQLLPLTPLVSLGTVQQQDLAGLATAIANLKRVDYLDVSQFPDLDALLGLPRRSPEELTRRAERAANPPTPPAQPGQPGQQADDLAVTPEESTDE